MSDTLAANNESYNLNKPCPKKYYGKYRGTVINNIDPMQQGRILARVTDVTGLSTTSWALPSFPAAGIAEGMFTVPPMNAGVWIEFEQGEPDKPIWTGCFMGSAADNSPLALAIPPGVSGTVIGTKLQNSFMVSDTPGPTGGILMKSTTGASITVNDTGIIIQNGKGASIVLAGPSVSINGTALVVT